MGLNTEISWTEHTLNLFRGCTKVSPLCDHCYAEREGKRWGIEWGNGAPRVVTKSWRSSLNKMRKAAIASGHKHRVFVGSMMDIAEKSMPTDQEGVMTGQIRDEFFKMVPDYPELNFLLLSKRPSNYKTVLPPEWFNGRSPANVMFGISVGTQKEADHLIPLFIECTPAGSQRFVSMEPLLERVTLPFALFGGIDWVIVGGESGPGARPMHPGWVTEIKNFCAESNIPLLFKQWGEYSPDKPDGGCKSFTFGDKFPLPGAIEPHTVTGGVPMVDTSVPVNLKLQLRETVYRVGKKAAGRKLYGVEYNGYPEWLTEKL